MLQLTMSLCLLFHKNATMVAISYLDYLIKKYYNQGRIVIKQNILKETVVT